MVFKPRKWWAAILLPVLLRALIPVGFMPMFGPGFSVSMVVCDGYAPAPSTAVMPADIRMDAPMDMGARSADSGGGRPVHHDGAHCPYGASPTLGALPTLARLAALRIQKPTERLAVVAQVSYVRVPPRAQSPRGPPA